MSKIKSAVPTFADFKAAYPINGEREARETWDQLSNDEKFRAVFYVPYHVSLAQGRSGIISTPLTYLLGGGSWRGYPAPIKRHLELKAGIVGKGALSNRLALLKQIRADELIALQPNMPHESVRLWPA